MDQTTFEQILRQEEEEEEEDARDDEADDHEEYDDDEEDPDLRESRGDSYAINDDDAAASTTNGAFSLQPSGWLTLENATDSGESKKRWCVLQRCFLFYAGRDKDLVHPKGVVDLKGCDVGIGRVDGPGAGAALPCAFVLTHPRRTALTFTAATEAERDGWIRALTHAIRAPTHALLNYKGRAIFDAEDALAISSSQAAIRGFVQSQFARLETQKREEALKLEKKRADIKTLKLQKRSLAKELIAATQSFEHASAESEHLSSDLESVQREGRAYDLAQKQFFETLIEVLNQMEECDPNRWSGPIGSATFSDGINYSTGTNAAHNIYSQPSSQGSARRTFSGHSSTDTDVYDDEYGSLPSSHFSHHTPPASRFRPSSVNTFSTPQQPHKTMAHTHAAQSPLSAHTYHHQRPNTASATFSPFSPAGGASLSAPPPTPQPSSIDISNDQLDLVQSQVDTLMQQSVPTLDGLASSSSSSNMVSSGSPFRSSFLPTVPSFSATERDTPLLTRNDALDLQEIRQVSLQLLQANIALRKEQNTLTQYIERWMTKKHAQADLK